jgi:hypothetical protein
MESKELAEYVDQQRWLINNGLANDDIKNQLFMYGSIVHKEVEAVELSIELTEKKVNYKIYVSKSLIEQMELYKRLSTSTGLIDMWRFKRMLKKGENLNFEHILRKFVRDFCGPKWSAAVEVLDIAEYAEGYEQGGAPSGPPTNKQPD